VTKIKKRKKTFLHLCFDWCQREDCRSERGDSAFECRLGEPGRLVHVGTPLRTLGNSLPHRRLVVPVRRSNMPTRLRVVDFDGRWTRHTNAPWPRTGYSLLLYAVRWLDTEVYVQLNCLIIEMHRCAKHKMRPIPTYVQGDPKVIHFSTHHVGTFKQNEKKITKMLLECLGIKTQLQFFYLAIKYS